MPDKRTVSRWIVIGEARRKFVVIGNAGFPDGYEMDWRGRTAWCQQWKFIRLEHLESAVRHRVAMADLVALEIKQQPGDYSDRFKVLVQVRRAQQ
jgi:hypothetical protein